ncbi:hypothetical protein ElyMa_000129000 [Elysia marginata]|uniref:Uncharacterized protein n=1 Tax=Elysia marginata TaxID=1093978 RepID=A0AAV4EP59_9GAST|nr:hypothetical protein ElyMa_000129000 [Elysia marginata]
MAKPPVTGAGVYDVLRVCVCPDFADWCVSRWSWRFLPAGLSATKEFGELAIQYSLVLLPSSPTVSVPGAISSSYPSADSATAVSLVVAAAAFLRVNWSAGQASSTD